MTSPTPDAQPSRFLPRQPHIASPTHSIPSSTPQIPPPLSLPMTPSSNGSAAGSSSKVSHEHAIDFATHSWDLATGGLKTLTAKRELPIRPDRRSADVMPDASFAGNYTFMLVVLTCIVLMLIGGGVVLFLLLQP